MLTTTTTFSVTAIDLYEALRKVRHAVSKEETRYYLQGVYMHAVKDQLRFCATDGHRLAVTSIKYVDGIASLTPVTIPVDTVDAILKSGIALRKHHRLQCWFSVSRSTIGFAGKYVDNQPVYDHYKTLDGTFPDYARVIPEKKDEDHEVVFNREDLLHATSCVWAFAAADRRPEASSIHGPAAKFSFEKDNVVITYLCDNGEARFVVKSGGPLTNGKIEIGFDGRYIAEALKACDAKSVRLRMPDASNPLSITDNDDIDGDTLFLIMPKRI